MVYNYLPFMILPIYNILQKIPAETIEAAQDLGASKRTVFSRVIFPLSIPGMISGITMVFVPAITTFAISRLLGGSQYMLYGDLIENQFIQINNQHLGSALSLVMMILVVISMMIMRIFDKDGEAGAV
jgi:ABC-type spermidine/putrescine transport system, permease component I